MQEKKKPHTISVVHLRGALGLLNWTAAELAAKSGVSHITISHWVTGKHRPTTTTKERIRKAFVDAGVEFSNGGQPGVRLVGVKAES
jgi:transcriptional regulator with XRE-family HTH domain